MALELKQNLRLSQQLVMTPQLQQAIKLLQLSRLELVDLIRAEIEQNPLLEEPSDAADSELAEVPAEHGAAMLDAMELSEVPAAAPAAENATQDVKAKTDGELQRSEIDWEQYLDNYQTQHTSPPGSGGMSSEDLPSLESTLTRPGGLTEHLLEQLRMAGLTPEEERVGALLIGNLDRDGYLVLGPDGPTALERELGAQEPGPAAPGGALSNGVESHAESPMSAGAGHHADAYARDDADGPEPLVSSEAPAAPEAKAKREKRSGVRAACSDPLLAIALEAGVTAATVEKVQRRIQRFDPVGCASRDLRECLLAQAHWFLTEGDGKDDPDADLLPQIIGRHLKNVETKKYPAIAKDLQVELNEVVAAIKLLGRLEPKPGRLFNTEEPQYITPDVYIHKVGEGYVTVLNDDGLSKLRISQHYRNALRQGGASGAKAKDYIQEKLRSAVWLIRSIHQRQRTIVKVTDSIIKFQRDFLDKGIAYLRPLILRDVAEDIGMHESTVSRVTTNKYVHTPQGIYELKYFFNSSIARVGGEDIASEAVKNQIRQIIAKEPADKPFSDQKIVEILRSQNVDIARRTVAKYREVLGILPSSKRKRYF
ncbi:MAG TPA: RNA polymerase factor sigma-54 [Myxococcales bacterium]|nr:RNA polymerase factor sigma-54 [Myxococcales bacterium]